MKIALMLRALGMSAIPLNGNMSQNKRLGSLNKFKAKSRDTIQKKLIRLFSLLVQGDHSGLGPGLG